MPRTGLCSRWGGRVLPLLLAYVCYLLLGATIFQLLEKQAESDKNSWGLLDHCRPMHLVLQALESHRWF